MAIINSVEKKGVIDVLLGQTLSIPVYQREYSWEEQDVKALLGDINQRVKDRSEHFFGTIALAEERNGALRVIDGQQRLTTTLLIYSVLLELINKNDEEKEEKYELKLNRLRELRMGHELSDTHLDANINSLIAARYKQLTDAFKKNYLLVNAQYKDKNLWELEKYLDTLERNFFVCAVLFRVEKKDEMVVFETLNSRGKPLADIDLIRNHLISLCTDPGKTPGNENVYARNLRAFNRYVYNKDLFKANGLKTSGQAIENALNEFFKSYTDYKRTITRIDIESTGHYSTFRNFKAVVDELRVKTFEDYEDLLIEINSFLILFVRMESEDKNQENVWLSVMGKKNTHYPLVFGLYKELASFERSEGRWTEPPELQEYFRMIAFYWLKLAAVKGTGQSLRSIWLEMLRQAQRGLTARQIYLLIQDEKTGTLFEIPSDSEFEASFFNSPVATWLPKAFVTILAHIAKEKAGMGERPSIKNSSLEHIMPQKPNRDKWPNVDAGSEDFKQTLNQIGNLAMLNGGKNASLGNNSFVEKKRAYQKSISPLLVGKDLGLPHICEYEDFGYEQIRQRSKILAAVLMKYLNDALVSKPPLR